MTNSRAAMVGIAAMLLTEQLLQRPLIMFGVEGKATPAPADSELNERLNAWAAEAGADLVADEDKVAMLFTSGKAATPKKAVKGKRAPAASTGGLFSAFAKGGASVKKNKGPGALYGTTASILVKN
jgi:acyl-coenzyme A synthetase/AMP-(fatty) acid ligase